MGPLSPRGALRMCAPLTLSSMLALCDAWPSSGPQSRPWTLIVMLMFDVAPSKMAMPRPVAPLITAGTSWVPSTAMRKAVEPFSARLVTSMAKL